MIPLPGPIPDVCREISHGMTAKSESRNGDFCRTCYRRVPAENMQARWALVHIREAEGALERLVRDCPGFALNVSDALAQLRTIAEEITGKPETPRPPLEACL